MAAEMRVLPEGIREVSGSVDASLLYEIERRQNPEASVGELSGMVALEKDPW